MDLFRKLLILVIILLTTYIVYRLYQKQQMFAKALNGSNPGNISNRVVEGFGIFTTPEAELSSVVVRDPVKIATASQTQNTLIQYVIKGSYNSACSGQFVSLDAIDYVLSRGCRFLDFEVYLMNGALYVATSTDPNYVIGSSNKILLIDVFSHLMTNGFSGKVPNQGDPLFIQLRIKSNNQDIFKMISMAVSSKLSYNMYKDPVTPKTRLSDLMGKVILVIDKTVAPDYSKYPDCSLSSSYTDLSSTDSMSVNNTVSESFSSSNKVCYNLSRQVNMVAGGDSLMTYTYSTVINSQLTPPHANDDDTTVNFFGGFNAVTVSTPNIDNSKFINPTPQSFYLDHGINIILYRFYLNDAGLGNYEALFNKAGYAITPMSNVLKLYKMNSSNAS